MKINELGHIHMTIIEIIIDGDEVDHQAIFERMRKMMTLLGETIKESDFSKEIEKLVNMNVILKVGSSPVQLKEKIHSLEDLNEVPCIYRMA